MPTRTYNAEALVAYVKSLKELYYDEEEDIVWGVRWDRPRLPVGHVFPNSFLCDDMIGEAILGTFAVDVHTLVCMMAGPDTDERDTKFCGVPYVVRGRDVNAWVSTGEVVLADCQIMALIDDCPSTRGVPLTYEAASLDAQWRVAIHEAGHAVVARSLGATVRYVMIQGCRGNPDNDTVGECCVMISPNPVMGGVFAAAGIQADLEIICADEDEKSLAYEGAHQDISNVMASCPVDRDAEAWRGSVESIAQQIVTESTEAIKVLALALMSGRDQDGYCKIKGKKIDLILASAERSVVARP